MIRSERGEFSLMGLLVTMMILGFVLTATYGAFDVFGRNVHDSQSRVEATDRARSATDAIAKQLRNLATPTSLQPNAVVLASSYDIVFETVSPTGTPPAANPQNVEFVRYCLDPTARKLWYAELPPSTITATTVPPASGGCPGGSWFNAKAVATDVVNTYKGADRPIFAFDTTTLNRIRRVSIDLFVDTTPGYGSLEQEVSSGVDLRNQDAPPRAAFTGTVAGGGVLVLDGTSSSDPDNDPLEYCWYDDDASGSVGTCGAHSIADSASFRYRTMPGTSHEITLVVTDPSGLSSKSAPQTFTTT